MEDRDYESESADNETMLDKNEDVQEYMEEYLDPSLCELTVQFERVLDVDEKELKIISPPGFYSYFLDIAKDDIDVDGDDWFGMPSGDVTWIPRVESLLSDLKQADKYTEIKRLIDVFMAGHFTDKPRHSLRGVRSFYDDSKDLGELHNSVCNVKYKREKYLPYAVLQIERWLFTDVKRKLRYIKHHAKKPNLLLKKKLRLAMMYAKDKLY
jgi:hypothetical protein